MQRSKRGVQLAGLESTLPRLPPYFSGLVSLTRKESAMLAPAAGLGHDRPRSASIRGGRDTFCCLE